MQRPPPPGIHPCLPRPILNNPHGLPSHENWVDVGKGAWSARAHGNKGHLQEGPGVPGTGCAGPSGSAWASLLWALPTAPALPPSHPGSCRPASEVEDLSSCEVSPHSQVGAPGVGLCPIPPGPSGNCLQALAVQALRVRLPRADRLG